MYLVETHPLKRQATRQACRPAVKRIHVLAIACVIFVPCMLNMPRVAGQMLAEHPRQFDLSELEQPNQTVMMKERAFIHEVLEPELVLRVDPTRSKIVRTKMPIGRIAISHPDIVDVNEFDAMEIEIIGKRTGEATLSLWFPQPDGNAILLRYLVQVVGNSADERRREFGYSEFQDRINELFPNSQVQLIPVGDKLIVRGQAKDSKAARDIMSLLGRQYGRNGNGANPIRRGQGFGRNNGPGGSGNRGGYNAGNQSYFDSHAQRGIIDNSGNGNGGALGGGYGNPLNGVQLVNMLHVPGVQQVMLKVRVAELSREAGREMGADLRALIGNVVLGSSSGADNFTAILDGNDVGLFLRAFATHGYGKILAEPTLVTISGKPARFLAGGEFAVPTTVGIGGVGAASTEFRGFGTELEFTPTVIDKDLVRLEVNPSFSSINNDATVNGIPGLNRRMVETTVDLREGQWLAIAGLIQDEQGGQRSRVPYLGDLPVLGSFFGKQNTTRTETELIVLVSPELVHPMEPEEVPLQLPGMEVTDPTDDDFFRRNMIEGYEGFDHRSTVWAEMAAQERGINSAGRGVGTFMQRCRCQQDYVCGPCGLSD
jgi:pilus assembly protein CpaC